jgi:hypothetical protein
MELDHLLGRQLFPPAVAAEDEGARGATGLAAVKPPRGGREALSPVGDHDVGRRGLEHLHESETAAKLPSPTRVRPEAGLGNAHGEAHLHRLHGNVHAVGHVGLDDVDPVLAWSRSHAPRSELAGHEGMARLRIPPPEGHDEKGARAGRGHAMGEGPDEGAEDGVGDALDGRGAAAHGGGGPWIHH